ncbi:hypothetical protein GN956_G4297 [Arapaima gigas]
MLPCNITASCSRVSSGNWSHDRVAPEPDGSGQRAASAPVHRRQRTWRALGDLQRRVSRGAFGRIDLAAVSEPEICIYPKGHAKAVCPLH